MSWRAHHQPFFFKAKDRICRNERLNPTCCVDRFPTVSVVSIIRFDFIVALPWPLDTTITFTLGITNANFIVIAKFIVLTFLASFIVWTELFFDDSHESWFTFCYTFGVLQWCVVTISGAWWRKVKKDVGYFFRIKGTHVISTRFL